MKRDRKNISQKNMGNDLEKILEVALGSPMLMRFARKLTRDQERAADLFQDTIERIIKYSTSFEHRTESYTRSWINGVMYGIFVNSYRRTKKWNSKIDEYRYLTFDGEYSVIESDEEIPESELSEIVLQALNSLTERQRKVTFLIAKDYKYNEIADILGVPMGTIMSTLSRGRKALRENERLMEYAKLEYRINFESIS